MITKNKNLIRININLPKDLVNAVKKYADKLQINVTSAYILLLNVGLENVK